MGTEHVLEQNDPRRLGLLLHPINAKDFQDILFLPHTAAFNTEECKRLGHWNKVCMEIAAPFADSPDPQAPVRPLSPTTSRWNSGRHKPTASDGVLTLEVDAQQGTHPWPAAVCSLILRRVPIQRKCVRVWG